MKPPAVALAARLALAVILVAVANTDGAALESSVGRISVGQDATRGQFPWQVYLEFDSPGHLPYNFCGGSVIDSEWVLTAAHCVEGRDYVKMRFGYLKLTDFTPGETVELNSSSIILHEEYNYTEVNKKEKLVIIHNDIAIIKLPIRLNFSDVIQPVKLPRRSQQNELFINETVTVSGWGAVFFGLYPSEYLLFAELTVALDADGNCTADHYICTVENAQAGAEGDDGGALVWKDDNDTSRQIGVYSQIDYIYDNQGGGPLVYKNWFTSVSYYLDWIVNKTGIEIED